MGKAKSVRRYSAAEVGKGKGKGKGKASIVTCAVRHSGYVSSSEARGPGDATKSVRGLKVHRVRILGTNHHVYSAWEPSVAAGRHFHGHGTVTTGLGETWGGWWGEVGTANLPADIDAIPVGQARWDAIDAWRKKENARAYAAIIAAFPEAASGERRDHQIEVWA